jgi:threonine dehydrogenase-like Zn-dependent dehydrogenase
MRANTWQGKQKVEVVDVPEPKILNSRDAIVKITSTAICGSDLHLYNGYIPTVKKGDVLGHEFMGEVVELGPGVGNLSVGDRVVVPFTVSCGACAACRREQFSVCENSNPNAPVAEKLLGHSPAGLFGYSHMLGGFPGGQAEYARVPFADVGPFKVEDDSLTDEQVLFLSDIFPTAFMGAEFCDISPGDVIAVWGAGPVGMLAAASAQLLGAEKVIVIDRFDDRLRLVAEKAGAETIDYEEVDVAEELRWRTAGRGPDAVIDAVGLEADNANPALAVYDKVKQTAKLETERPHALREAIINVRNGGIVSVIGAYGGLIDKFPMGAVLNRSLTLKGAQCHVQRYMRPLYERIVSGEIDPSFVISHVLPLEQAAHGFDIFINKADHCTKVVLKP